MSSLFSFLRNRAETPDEELPTEPSPAEVPTAEPALVEESPAAPIPSEEPAPEAAMAEALPANTAATPDQALAIMLEALGTYLPSHDASDPFPAPGVSVVSVTERTVGLGNRRGTERRGPFAVVELKGGRLDAVVRFQLWEADASAVDTAVAALQGRLLATKDELWNAGFLRIAAEDTSPAEEVSSAGAWRKTADYGALYEFHYHDADGAESIIARIPIHSDPEERGSLQRETTVVTDEMVRWDDEEASPLELAASVRSDVRVDGLAILAYLPAGWTGNPVTLSRLDRTSTEPPTDYPTLDDFLEAVTDQADPDRHARVTFASVADFLAEFESQGDPIELGDWDEDGTLDAYQPGVLRFDSTMTLATGNDLIRLSYADSAFDTPAVVYVRVGARAI